MAQFKDKEEYEKWKADKIKNNIEKLQHPPTEKDQYSPVLPDVTPQEIPVSFHCPKCHAENIQKASLIVSLETKALSASTATIGLGATRSGAGIGISGSATRGTLTAALAQQLGQPKKPQRPSNACLIEIWVVSLLIVLGSLGALIDGGLEAIDAWAPFAVVAPLIAIGGPLVYRRVIAPERKKQFEQATAQYTRDMATWEKTYCCLRCGEVFQL